VKSIIILYSINFLFEFPFIETDFKVQILLKKLSTVTLLKVQTVSNKTSIATLYKVEILSKKISIEKHYKVPTLPSKISTVTLLKVQTLSNKTSIETHFKVQYSVKENIFNFTKSLKCLFQLDPNPLQKFNFAKNKNAKYENVIVFLSHKF
jgi:hypothetical protein